MKKFLVLAMSLLVGAVAATAGCKVVTDTIQSRVLGAPRAYTVVLPDGYDKSTDQYPVVYLLHGMYGHNHDWVKSGNLPWVVDRLTKSGEMIPMIIVTPDAGGDYSPKEPNGYFNMEEWPYEDFFFQEFIPAIEGKYRSNGQRAIGGLSMGGGGTAVYVEHHPDLFSAAYMMSALAKVDTDRHKVEGGNEWIRRFNKSAYENCPTRGIEEADAAKRQALANVEWWIDCGDGDFLLDTNTDFYAALRKAGIPAQLRVRDGEHDWEYWHTALYNALPMFSRNFLRK